MVNELAQKFLEHPRRVTIVWATAGAFALMFVVPAWDRLSVAHEQVTECETEYREISYSIANLDLMRSKVAEASSGAGFGDATIDFESAENVREKVTQLTHEMGCRVRRLTMSDPYVRPWGENDDPFEMDSAGDAEETNFMLETRTLTLSVDGTLTQLTKLTIALTQLDPFAVPSNMNLEREGIDGHLTLEVEISLFNLVETFD